MWTQEEAIDLCRKVEEIAPKYGCHVALTGGLLYKDGSRKDCDLLFYRIRQVEAIDKDGLFDELHRTLRLSEQSGFGWCHKAIYSLGSLLEDKPVDMFFPEGGGTDDEEQYPVNGGA